MREVEASINLLLRADGDEDQIRTRWEPAPRPSPRDAVDGDDAPDEITEEVEE